MKKTKFIISIFIIMLIVIFPLTINASQINPDDYDLKRPRYSFTIISSC